MNSLVVLVYADRLYYKFVFPYIFFVLRANKSAYIDVVVDDFSSFKKYAGDGYDEMEAVYAGRFSVRQTSVNYPRIIPNTIRFLETPIKKADYVYIGDIDILVFEDLVKLHLELISKNHLDFSNVVREKTIGTERPRLTGLHFTEYKRLYPLQDISDLDLSVENDEYVLYELCKRKGNTISLGFKERPECGIHLSLNRDPLGRISGSGRGRQIREKTPRWGGEKYHGAFLECYQSSEYRDIEKFFDYDFKLIAFQLYSIAIGKHRSLELYAKGFIDNRQFFLNQSESKDIKNYIRCLREAGSNFYSKKSVVLELISIFPYNFLSWFYGLCFYASVGDFELSYECLEKMGLLSPPENLSAVHLSFFLECCTTGSCYGEDSILNLKDKVEVFFNDKH